VAREFGSGADTETVQWDPLFFTTENDPEFASRLMKSPAACLGQGNVSATTRPGRVKDQGGAQEFRARFAAVVVIPPNSEWKEQNKKNNSP